MARSRFASAVAVALALTGCSSTRQTVAGWFGQTPPATPAAAQEGHVYYAAVDGLTVYAEASQSSKVVGHLAMHERVTRSRIERGYAYIKAGGSGLEGWVDNAQLAWRPPAASGETEPQKGERGAAGSAGSTGSSETTRSESVPAAPPTPTSTATPGPEGGESPTMQPTRPTRQAAPKSSEPAMFDPY
jgi:hypothetical protein